MSLLLDGIARLGRSLSQNSSNDDAISTVTTENSTSTQQESNDLQRPVDDDEPQVEMTVAFTAQICAACRALECERDESDRLIDDYLAKMLAGPTALGYMRYKMKQPDSQGRSRVGRIPIRARYFDDFITETISKMKGNENVQIQLVSLGSGMDTRAYRLPIVSQLSKFFEIDTEEIVSLKASLLATVVPPPIAIGPQVSIVVADLVKDNWTEGLLEKGFDVNALTIWIVEGVLYYLEEKEVMRLLNRISAMSSTGSRIGFSAISSLAQNRDRASANTARKLFVSSMADPSGTLDSVGFRTDHVDVFQGPRVNYGRFDEEDILEPDEWKTERRGIYVTGTKK